MIFNYSAKKSLQCEWDFQVFHKLWYEYEIVPLMKWYPKSNNIAVSLGLVKSMKMQNFNYIFCIIFLLSPHQCDGAAKCRKPTGYAGDVRVKGCSKKTCTGVTRTKGVWLEAPSMWVYFPHYGLLAYKHFIWMRKRDYLDLFC